MKKALMADFLHQGLWFWLHTVLIGNRHNQAVHIIGGSAVGSGAVGHGYSRIGIAALHAVDLILERTVAVHGSRHLSAAYHH